MHIRHKLLLLAGWFAAACTVSAIEFATDFSSPLPEKGAQFWRNAAGAVQSFTDRPVKNALVLEQGKPNPELVFEPMPDADEDFRISFDMIRLDLRSAAGVALFSPSGKPWGTFFADSTGGIRLWSSEGGKYLLCPKVRMEPGQLRHIDLVYYRGSGKFEVRVDGGAPFVSDFPAKNPLRRIYFSAQPPVAGSRTLVSNLEFATSPQKIVGRDNAALGVEAVADDGKRITRYTDGDLVEAQAVPFAQALTLRLPKRINAVGAQIYVGNPAAAAMPSGDCSATGITVEGLSNGTWLPLGKTGKLERAFPAGSTSQPGEKRVRLDFSPIPVDAVRIRFHGSYDTGKRASGSVIAPADYFVGVREIEIFSDEPEKKQLALGKMVQAEFRLPVYQNRDEAELTIVVGDVDGAPETATLRIFAPDGKTVLHERKLVLKKGVNAVKIDLRGLADGRYPAVVDFGKPGTMKRLLRIDRPQEVRLDQEPCAEMSGKKLFFTPDGFRLAGCENLRVETFPPKQHTLWQSTADYPAYAICGLYRLDNGKFLLEVTERPTRNVLSAKPQTSWYESSVITGPYEKLDKAPTARRLGFLNFRPRPGVRGTSCPPPPRGTKYQFYDPGRDGKIPLHRIHMVFNAYWPEKDWDYGCVKAPARCRWPAGLTADGRWVLMTPEPIIRDKYFYGEGEYDTGFQTNDNAFGQWIVGDKLYYANGQTVRRDPPYGVGYDNLATCFRILALWETADGVNWKFSRYVVPPDETDTTGAQHYGASMSVIGEGELFLAYVIDYESEAQCNYLELAWSRDGINFHRFPGHKPFARVTEPFEPGFGYINSIQGRIHRVGDRIYHFVNHVSRQPHFADEVSTQLERRSDATAAMFRKRFAERGFAERWPYFEKLGGWDGPARMVREMGDSALLLECRFDGWFGLTASDRAGSFTTRPMRAAGKLTANAEVRQGGFIRIAAVDGSGRELARCELSGNGIELPCFALPDGEFTLRCEMKNAVLYTLNFGDVSAPAKPAAAAKPAVAPDASEYREDFSGKIPRYGKIFWRNCDDAIRADAPGAMVLKRGEKMPELVFDPVIAPDRNFCIEFDLERLDADAAAGLCMLPIQGRQWGGIFVQAGGLVNLFSAETQKYVRMPDVVIEPGKKYHFEADYDRAAGKLTLTVDGSAKMSMPIPSGVEVRRILFAAQPPAEGTRTRITGLHYSSPAGK